MSSTPPPPPPPPPGDGGQGSSYGPGAFDQGAPAPGSGPPTFEPDPFGADRPAGQRNTMALAALILGLIAFPGVLLIGFVPFLNLLTILTPVLAIVAIVLGIVGIRRAKRPTINGGVGMGVTGIVLGAINLLLTAAVIAGAVMFVRACPEVMEATTPDEAVQRALECAEEQGVLAPGEIEQLEDDLDEGP